MENNWMELLGKQNQVQAIMKTNEYSEKFGLTLSEKDTQLLVTERKNSLKEQKRVEFGEGIMPKLIYAFCDSDFVNQRNYTEILAQLQDIFYLYKNEMQDEITDDELIHFMREQYENVCFGDLDYLAGTCLDIFAQAVRAGYRYYQKTDGEGTFTELDPIARWDYQLYQQALQELFWK